MCFYINIILYIYRRKDWFNPPDKSNLVLCNSHHFINYIYIELLEDLNMPECPVIARFRDKATSMAQA